MNLIRDLLDRIFCLFVWLFLALYFSGCAGSLQTKVSGNLAKISAETVVAILPVQLTGKGQDEAANLFRQSLYASMEQSRFRVMERYLVDALLEQNEMLTFDRFKSVNPLFLGEILGADAVVFPVLNKIERTYAVIHSSIELSVSAKMVDTRNGEVLWISEQNETEYDGIVKIPTGITAAALAPVQFITNKINLHRLIQKMTSKLTELVRFPDEAQPEETFKNPVINPFAEKEIKTVSVALPSPSANISAPISTKELDDSPELFTVQIGAYTTHALAKKMIGKLSGKGYQTFIRKATSNGKKIFKVHVKKFRSYEEAKRYGKMLWHKEHLDHFVTRFQPD